MKCEKDNRYLRIVDKPVCPSKDHALSEKSALDLKEELDSDSIACFLSSTALKASPAALCLVPSASIESRRRRNSCDAIDLSKDIRHVQKEEANGVDQLKPQDCGKLRRPSYQLRNSLKRPSFSVSARRSSFKKTTGSVDMDTDCFHATVQKSRDETATYETPHLGDLSKPAIPRRRASLISHDYRTQRKKSLKGRGCSFSQNVVVETYDATLEIQGVQPSSRCPSRETSFQESSSSVSPTDIEKAIQQVQEEYGNENSRLEQKISPRKITRDFENFQRRRTSNTLIKVNTSSLSCDSMKKSLNNEKMTHSNLNRTDFDSIDTFQIRGDSMKNSFNNEKMTPSNLNRTDFDSIDAFQIRDDGPFRNRLSETDVPAQLHMSDLSNCHLSATRYDRAQTRLFNVPASTASPLFGAPILYTKSYYRLDNVIQKLRSIKPTAKSFVKLFIILTMLVSYAGYFRSNTSYGSLRKTSDTNEDDVVRIIEDVKKSQEMVHLLQSKVSELHKANDALRSSEERASAKYGLHGHSMQLMNETNKSVEEINATKS
jgi:hypothetical protein